MQNHPHRLPLWMESAGIQAGSEDIRKAGGQSVDCPSEPGAKSGCYRWVAGNDRLTGISANAWPVCWRAMNAAMWV